jgi:adenylate kinase family enzyme
MARLAILGNSGSGKSTLARWIAERTGSALLDLDTVAWERGRIAVARNAEFAKADVLSFCQSNPNWVVEGCYASLIAHSLQLSPRLIFLNPGEEACAANCRARPWEPHKYSSRHEQDQRLAFLLSWVREYYTRDGDMSLAEHRRCFSSYDGLKSELIALPAFDPPTQELLELLH